MEAKTFEKDINYIFRITKYLLPMRDDFKVYTHKVNRTTIKSSFKELYKDHIGNLCLQLVYRSDSSYPDV